MYLQKDKQKNLEKKLVFCWHLEGLKKIAGSGSISQRHGSADLDPYQNVMEPKHYLAGCWLGRDFDPGT